MRNMCAILIKNNQVTKTGTNLLQKEQKLSAKNSACIPSMDLCIV